MVGVPKQVAATDGSSASTKAIARNRTSLGQFEEDQCHVHQSNKDPEIQISPIFDNIEVSNAISKLTRNTQPFDFEFLLH